MSNQEEVSVQHAPVLLHPAFVELLAEIAARVSDGGSYSEDVQGMPEMLLEKYVRQLEEILPALCESSGSLFALSSLTVSVERDAAGVASKLEVNV
jgi:hypothetical protein